MKFKNFLTSFLVIGLIGALVPINVHASNDLIGQFVFDLNATVYDYGEAIDQVHFSIDSEDPTGLGDLKFDPNSIDENTFTVKASATNPYSALNGKTMYGEYTDVERTIENVSVSSDGREVIIDLKTEYNGAGQSTLNWVADDVSRNMSLDITYTLEQNLDYTLTNGTIVKDTSDYTMGKISNPEVEAFNASSFSDENSSIKYQHYTPDNANDGNKHPLIIWFHGNGEGGYSGIENNTSQLQGNRGAIGFTTSAAQNIFGGAYVLAPQAPDTWYNNYSNGYIKTMTALIDNYAQKNNVDTDRIYVYGCSAGGYMTTRMAIENLDLFAAVVPTCPAIDVAADRGGVETTDAEIQSLKDQNIWLVQSKDDTTVLEKDCAGRMAALLDNAIYTPYETVTVDGVAYPGHWSWIYTARNMPTYNGQTLFEWTANQKLVSSTTPTTPDPKPTTPDPKPTTPDPKPTETESKPSGDVLGKTVQTDDTSTPIIYMSVAALALCGVYFTLRKRKTQ